jgi:single-strand DNA-binding protein
MDEKCCMKNCRDREGVRNMSKSINKVFLLGNLTRDPELKQSEGKKPMCIFGLATNRSWTTGTGEKREETEFHRIVAWDKQAETCQRYLKKGRKVHVEGRLHTRVYTDKEGIKREVTEIVLEDMVMLDKMPDDVKKTMDLQDALTDDTSNGAPVQV